MTDKKNFRNLRCFTWRGRMRRLPYFIWGICLTALMFAIGYILPLAIIVGLNLDAGSGRTAQLMLCFSFPVTILFSIFTFFTLIQRLHDIGISGWWILLILFVYSLISVGFRDVGEIVVAVIGLVIMLWPSDSKDNKFGINVPENGAFFFKPEPKPMGQP